MVALHARGLTGRGQVADVAITESMIGALGAQLPVFDKLGLKPDRVGNLSNSNAPRNVYRCADDRWVAVSAPAQSVADRVMRLVGRPELIEEAWFSTGTGRVAHRAVVDEAVSRWIAERSRDEVVAEFEAVEAAVAPIYEVDDVLKDPHFQVRNVAIDVPDDELGSVRMQNVPFRLSATPGSVRWAGPRLGEHTEAVLEAVKPKTADAAGKGTMSKTAEHQSWDVLDPSTDPSDPEEYLRTAIRWHFGNDTGSPFWLRRAALLDFDPITDVRTFDDLRLFPNIVDELRMVPVEDLIPRGYGPKTGAPRVFESGGTTGAPKRAILMPDWIESAVNRMLYGPQFAGRDPGNILVLTPTGPHKIGGMYDYIAERQNTIKFSIDMDPRWVKKLISRGDTDQAAAYVDHLLSQAEHILSTQQVALLVVTPPLLRACTRNPRLVELINSKVDLMFWGGAHMTVEERFELQHEYFPNVRMLSRYGSLMILESAQERPGLGPDEDIVYDPRSPVVTFTVVDPATGEAVPYGRRGQIVMNHVSKGMFLPHNLERDTVIRVPGLPGQIGDSVSSPAPVDTFGGETVIEGVY